MFATRVKRRAPLVEQELLTIPEFIPGFSGIRVVRPLIFSFLCFCRSLYVLLAIVFSVLFWFRPFRIFIFFITQWPKRKRTNTNLQNTTQKNNNYRTNFQLGTRFNIHWFIITTNILKYLCKWTQTPPCSETILIIFLCVFILVESETGRLSPINYNSVYLKYLP